MKNNLFLLLIIATSLPAMESSQNNNSNKEKSVSDSEFTGSIKDLKAFPPAILEKEILSLFNLSLLIDWNANTIKDMFIPMKRLIKNMLLIKKNKSEDFNLENELTHNLFIKKAKELMQAVLIADQVIDLVPQWDDIINCNQPATKFSEKFPELWKNKQFISQLKKYTDQKGPRNFTISYNRCLSEEQYSYLLNNNIRVGETDTSMHILLRKESTLSEEDKKYKQFLLAILAPLEEYLTTQPSPFMIITASNPPSDTKSQSQFLKECLARHQAENKKSQLNDNSNSASNANFGDLNNKTNKEEESEKNDDDDLCS